MSKCTGSKPIKCTFPVPADGNYNVTVELGSATAASTSQVEAELGRIVVPAVKLAAGVYSQQTFSVSVHNETHDDYTAPDKQLDVLINGDAPALHGIGYAAANIPTLFVVGDSTVCDWSPDTHSQRGWAQEFSIYLKPGLAVANYADSGDTASSLYPKFTSRMGGMMKKGDYIFIQFGHNDQKIALASSPTYKANLMKYVTDARNAMATPDPVLPGGATGLPCWQWPERDAHTRGSGLQRTRSAGAGPGSSGEDRIRRLDGAGAQVLRDRGPFAVVLQVGRDHPLQYHGRHRHREWWQTP